MFFASSDLNSNYVLTSGDNNDANDNGNIGINKNRDRNNRGYSS